MPYLKSSAVALSLACLISSNAGFADTTAPLVSTTEVSENIYMLSGDGGNVGVKITDSGTIMVDDKFSQHSSAIVDEIKRLGGDTPEFLINTHYHFDHTGGNNNFGKFGSVIVSHDNVRKRLKDGTYLKAFESRIPPVPLDALPVVTYSETMHLHPDDSAIRLVHLANAHTDGDTIVFFEDENVLHAGDIFFNGFYPFIDSDHGGSLAGTIKASQAMMEIINDDTQIIPGHGPLADKAALQRYIDMLKGVETILLEAKQSGKTLNDITTDKILADYEKDWGQGFLSTDKWLAIIYPSL